MKPTKKEIETGLKQLVEIKFLRCKDKKYRYLPNYKKTLMKCKEQSTYSILLESLRIAGYFNEPKTTREIAMVCQLLLLK